jgi:hypothetical protein
MALPNTTAAGGVNMQDIIANYKEIYGEFKDLVPSDLKMCNLVKYQGGDKQLGNEFHEPVVLSMEGGVTYMGSSGAIADLNKYVALSVQDAKVKSVEMMLRSAISTGAVSRSAKDSNSFKRALKLLIGNMQKSMFHRLEVALLYGQDSIGVVDTAAVNGTDDSLIDIVIEASEWATGIWAVTNKHKVDFLSATLAAKRAHSGVSELVIFGYDFENQSIQVQAVDASGAPVSLLTTTIIPTDKIFFKGEVLAGATPEHYNMIGLKAIAEKRGVLFSINNSNVPLFQGNIIAPANATAIAPKVLDFATVEKAAAKSAEKGVTSTEATCLVSVHSWNNLLIDQAAKRRYTGSEVGTLKEGGRELEFLGQTGVIKIVPSTFVKDGYSFVFSEKDLMRIGSSDVTMEPPGHEGEPIRFLEEASGYQARAYSDQCLFTSRPGSITVIQYLTNEEA